MVEWSWVASPTTVIAIITTIIGFGGWLFSSGGKFKELSSVQDRLTEVQKALDGKIVELKKSQDLHQVAVNAGLDMCRQNLSEYKAEAADKYASKSDMIALEERTNKGMDRIVDRLDSISGRLEKIGDTIMTALAEGRRPG